MDNLTCFMLAGNIRTNNIIIDKDEIDLVFSNNKPKASKISTIPTIIFIVLGNKTQSGVIFKKKTGFLK